jgi:drug/metabolite transporter (DMT)-like permease
MNKTVQAHIALVIVSLIYAATFSVAKQVMPAYIPPQAFVVLRSGVAMVLFWLVSFLFINEKVKKEDIPRLAILGACGVAINQSLFLTGLSKTTPINASIIMVSNPVFVLLIAAIILKEKISIHKIIGIGFGIAGALLLLMFNKNFSFGSDTLVGDAMVLVNSMSWAIYVVLVKPLMQKYNAFTIVKWVFLFGFIYVLPFGYHEFKLINFAAMPSDIWRDIVFVVLGSTFLVYTLNTYALKALSPSAVSVYVYFQPFLTTLIAVFYYHNDALDTRKIISGILIVIGVILVSKPFKSSEKIKE